MPEINRESETMQENEIRYRPLYDKIPVSLYRATPAGTFLEVNLAMVEMLGYPSRDALLATSPVDHYVNSRDREHWKTVMTHEEGTYTVEFQIRRHDGTILWVSNTVRAERDEQGNVLYYEGCLIDITERKRVEAEREQLMAAEREQRRVADAVRQAGAALNSTLEYEEVLKRILEQMRKVVPHDSSNIMLLEGETAQVIQGVGYEQFGTQLSITSITLDISKTPILKRMQTTGQPEAIPYVEHDKEWVYSRPEHRWIKSYAGAPIRLRDQVLGFLNINSATPGFFTPTHANRLLAFADQAAIAIENARLYRQAQEELTERRRVEAELRTYQEHLEDLVKERTADLSTANAQLRQEITERKRTEEQLQEAKDAAEAANRAKSEFLANMSHEIRTPMNAVLGFAELLSTEITEPKQRMYVDSIYSSGKNLLSLINDILDLSKIEAGKLEIQPESVNLRSLFQEIEQIFSFRVAQKGLEFTTVLAPVMPDYLLLDEVRLRQVLVNLLGNAVKFTEHGAITLSANPLAFPDEQHVDLLVSVKDTGIGISADDQQAIFAAFQQQTGQLAKDFGGTGLGLAISKRLVEMMGGTISVTSQVGQGSRFEICLRHVAVTTAPMLSEPETTLVYDRLVFHQATILVVDDIATNRQLITEFLRDVEVTIIEAENGKKAVRQARDSHPDLILMDLKMPEMDGYEALREIRNPKSEIQNIPIIALTASAMKEDQEQVRYAGFDDSLLKPIERQALLKTLCRFLQYSEKEIDEAGEVHPEEPEQKETLSPETLERLPELLEKLEHEMMEQWELARQKQRIPDIETFGKQIKSLGEHFGIPMLSAFGEELLLHVNNFDIDQMRATLDAYPDAVKQIQHIQA